MHRMTPLLIEWQKVDKIFAIFFVHASKSFPLCGVFHANYSLDYALIESSKERRVLDQRFAVNLCLEVIPNYTKYGMLLFSMSMELFSESTMEIRFFFTSRSKSSRRASRFTSHALKASPWSRRKSRGKTLSEHQEASPSMTTPENC